MKYRDFLKILHEAGFVEIRRRGDHHQLRGEVGGLVRLVTLSYAQAGQDITPKNLASMINQSGLPKRRFR